MRQEVRHPAWLHTGVSIAVRVESEESGLAFLQDPGDAMACPWDESDLPLRGGEVTTVDVAEGPSRERQVAPRQLSLTAVGDRAACRPIRPTQRGASH